MKVQFLDIVGIPEKRIAEPEWGISNKIIQEKFPATTETVSTITEK